MDVIILVVSIVTVLITVQKGLCRGIDHLSLALSWSPKIRGQVTGFATSIPEFAALISTALAGVWTAGLWNIASSNIINVAPVGVDYLVFDFKSAEAVKPIKGNGPH